MPSRCFSRLSSLAVAAALALVCTGASAAVPRRAAMTISYRKAQLQWTGTAREPVRDKSAAVVLQTNVGEIHAQLHPAVLPDGSASRAGVVWVGGAGGGIEGPSGMYRELAEKFQAQGITSLRLDYREANDLDDCILDTLAGVAFLGGEGIRSVIVVGWSFGGAVVIEAAAVSPAVKGVVTFATRRTASKAQRSWRHARSCCCMARRTGFCRTRARGRFTRTRGSQRS